MLILPQEVEIKLNSRNIKHFEDKGYPIPRRKDKRGEITVSRGTTIIVKVEDLLPSSQAMVKCLCDYCLKNDKEVIYKTKYIDYLTAKNKSLSIGLENVDACEICRKSIKVKETVKQKYGVDKIMDIPYFKEKNASKRRKTIDIIDRIFLERGYLPRFIYYKNTQQLLPFICKKHFDKGIQYVRYVDLMKIECGCKYCSNELKSKSQTFSHEYAESFYTNKNYILLDTYIKHDIPMRYVCESHPCEIQMASLATVIINKHNCKYCHSENSMGSNNWNWKNGITLFRGYFYKALKNWRKDSMKVNGYKCILTGDKDFHIHHLYSFNKILKETIDILNIEIHNTIGDYTNDELIKLTNTFLKLHEKYGFGIPINKKLHNLYHSITLSYGDDNTPEQFEEFKNRLKFGEFDLFLKENNLTLVI